jgi:hypothetical protein
VALFLFPLEGTCNEGFPKRWVNITYKLEKAAFAPSVAYSADVAGSSAAPDFVGRLDLEFGQLTPAVSGLQSPHGLAFVKTSDGDDSLREQVSGRPSLF